MRLNGFSFVCAVFAGLHLAALGFACGPWHWQYLVVAVASGVLLWGALLALAPPPRWTGLLIGAALGLAVQQAAFWIWRAKLGGAWFSMAQFVSLHFLIALGLRRLRHRRTSALA